MCEKQVRFKHVLSCFSLAWESEACCGELGVEQGGCFSVHHPQGSYPTLKWGDGCTQPWQNGACHPSAVATLLIAAFSSRPGVQQGHPDLVAHHPGPEAKISDSQAACHHLLKPPPMCQHQGLEKPNPVCGKGSGQDTHEKRWEGGNMEKGVEQRWFGRAKRGMRSTM